MAGFDNINGKLISFVADKNDNSIKSITDKTIDEIALECLKKANFDGSTDEVLAEFLRIREKLINAETEVMQNKKKIPQTVFYDYIICLEDGLKMQMLKRHLKTKYNMTFQEYKQKWGLPIDYPYVCEKYSKVRARIAGHRRKKEKK
ncbi:MAG: MucR family transcriptional regulator [Rickettsiales bacterium]|nr:MucR family transcriptional regulator [Rickettsiales bacterium]